MRDSPDRLTPAGAGAAPGGMLFASLPWYDLPEMRDANAALWSALAAQLRALGVNAVPATLYRQPALTSAAAGARAGEDALLTQTCGYPLLTTERARFSVIGAPCYDVAGCTGPLHRSFIVTREDARASRLADLRATRFALNAADSNTGMNLPRLAFAPLARGGRFFAQTIVTGSHAASAELVSAGGADAAAIDCVTFAFLARYRPAAVRQLRILAQTAAAPAPPLVTSRATDGATSAALGQALRAVVRDKKYADVRAALFLTDIEFCGEAAYGVVLEYEREAVRLGYPELR